MTVPLRAALYLRVSTARQAEHDVSIPDQKRQGESYCQSRGYQLAETYVEPGASATNDRRPEFQRMIEAGTSKPAPFDVVIVHSFSRFFRDHFELEFYVRKLAKNGVRLVSITQEMGDDPMHVMMRQIMALFDEYQSKENAKHVLRALKENARQGFWNGSLPPIGYRVVAAEQRGAKVKKKLEIDPLHAETVRLIYRLALEGDGTSGQMGVKNITAHLNRQRIFTRDGGRWGIGQVHRILTRATYIGRHEFNKRSKSKELKPVSEVIAVEVPPLIDQATFDAVQIHLRARNPKVTPARVVSGPTLLTGICFCADCGGAMTLRTGKGGRYRYYTCSTKARQGETGCKGRSIPMEKLDNLVAGHIEERLLQPDRLEEILASVLDRRQERTERRRAHIAELNKRAAETDLRLKRLYDAIESGIAELDDPALKERIAGLNAIRDQAQADADRAHALALSAGQQAITPAMVQKFATTARERIRITGGGYRRDHLRALAQRVEVADKEVRIMGSKGDLLRTLAASSGVKQATPGVRSFVPSWRRGWQPHQCAKSLRTQSCPDGYQTTMPRKVPQSAPRFGERRRRPSSPGLLPADPHKREIVAERRAFGHGLVGRVRAATTIGGLTEGE
jgi:DNA invertase Pin-like site-specific DNA recombinase